MLEYTESLCGTDYQRVAALRGCPEDMKVHKASDTISFLTEELFRGVIF